MNSFYFPGDSLLHLSAFSGNESAGLFLLAQGAQPNHANKKGETPLHASALKGHERLVRELLKRYELFFFHFNYKFQQTLENFLIFRDMFLDLKLFYLLMIFAYFGHCFIFFVSFSHKQDHAYYLY